jgi:hypothetical protein
VPVTLKPGGRNFIKLAGKAPGSGSIALDKLTISQKPED